MRSLYLKLYQSDPLKIGPNPIVFFLHFIYKLLQTKSHLLFNDNVTEPISKSYRKTMAS